MKILFNTALGAFKAAHRWELALMLSPEDEVGQRAAVAACAKGSQWQLGDMASNGLK